MTSRLETDAPRLSFHTHDDALHYAAALVEEVNRRFRKSELPDIVEAYRRGDIEIRVWARNSRDDPRDLYFAVHALSGTGVEANARPSKTETDCVEISAHKGLMFVDVCEFVETVEGFIPSRIRLEGNHHVEDFGRDVLRGAFSSTSDLSERIAEREIGVLGFWPSARSCSSKSEMIKCSSQVLDGIGSKAGNGQGNRPAQLQDLDPSAWIKGIWLDHQFARVVFDERLREFFNAIDVSFRMLKDRP